MCWRFFHSISIFSSFPDLTIPDHLKQNGFLRNKQIKVVNFQSLDGPGAPNPERVTLG